MSMRIGNGFDAHRLVEDRKLILGGVDIPYERGLLGHSDADVVTHAIMDALLGAASLGDIGKHFPDTAVEFKDISSLELLRKVRQAIFEYDVVNVDAVIVAQSPKLAPYINDMKENISKILETDNINIKATTTEKMGYEGRGEGISAYSVCLIVQKAER